MNKARWLKQTVKVAAVAAVVAMPALAHAGVVEEMAKVAAEIDKLESGIEAIGAVAIGIAVTIKGYRVGKRMIGMV